MDWRIRAVTAPLIAGVVATVLAAAPEATSWEPEPSHQASESDQASNASSSPDSAIRDLAAKVKQLSLQVESLPTYSESTQRRLLPNLQDDARQLLATWQSVGLRARKNSPTLAVEIDEYLKKTLQNSLIAPAVNWTDPAEQRKTLLETPADQITITKLIEANNSDPTGMKAGLIEVLCLESNPTCGKYARSIDVPVRADFSTPEPPFILTFFAAKIDKTARENSSFQRTGSYESGKTVKPNPAYQVAVSNLQLAQANLQSAIMSQTTAAMQPGGFAGGFARGAAAVAVGQARRAVQLAQQKLNQTPSTTSTPVLVPYTLNVTELTALQSQRIGIALINTKTNIASIYSLNKTAEKQFFVAEPMNEHNPRKIQYSTSSDVQKWLDQDQGLTILLSDLKDLSPTGSIKLRNVTNDTIAIQLRSTFFGMHSTVAESETPSAISDARMKFVVLIKNSNSVGSGFFVGPHYILTNAHVVSGATTVSVRPYKSDIFESAEVVSRDERRDLALLRVSSRHEPAKLAASDAFTVAGKQVVVIGHPSGLDFSLTSGVISALRTNLISMPGVKLIQTDAALNPGNSGGPLFVGNSVIGIVTAKRISSDGLGFAIHSEEIQNFLQTAFLY